MSALLDPIARQINSIERIAEMAERIAADEHSEHEQARLDIGDLVASIAELARAAEYGLANLSELATKIK